MTEPITEEYLLSLATAQQRNSGPYGYDRCPNCGPQDGFTAHSWHGLQCRAQIGAGRCDCPGSGRAAA